MQNPQNCCNDYWQHATNCQRSKLRLLPFSGTDGNYPNSNVSVFVRARSFGGRITMVPCLSGSIYIAMFHFPDRYRHRNRLDEKAPASHRHNILPLTSPAGCVKQNSSSLKVDFISKPEHYRQGLARRQVRAPSGNGVSRMARLPRVIGLDVPHHVTQRGNARRSILDSDSHRRIYLDLLTQNLALHTVTLIGYCLMSNHVHLIVIPHKADSLALAVTFRAIWRAFFRAN